MIRCQQRYNAIGVHGTNDQTLAHKRADLFSFKVNSRDDLPPDQLLGLLTVGNLRTGFKLANVAAKIDP